MKSEFLKVLDFAVHLLVGALMFMLLGATALGVGLFVEFVDAMHYSVVLHYGLKFLEYFMFAVDVVLFSVHVSHGLVKLFAKK